MHIKDVSQDLLPFQRSVPGDIKLATRGFARELFGSDWIRG